MAKDWAKKPQHWSWTVIPILMISIVLLATTWSCKSIAPSSAPGKALPQAVSLIELSGVIMSEPLGGFGSGASITPRAVKDLLNKAENDSSSLLVLSISSPGGSVAPTQEIYEHLVHFKQKSGKKVYVWMRDVAASGGYYIACPADKIFAMPSTITGSIGVILQLINYEELLAKIGIKEQNLKSGKFKDMGSPGQTLNPEVQLLLQNLVDEQFELFFQTVLKHRNIPQQKLRDLTQGQIFTGSQAQKNGLIDGAMSWYEFESQIKTDMNWTEDIQWLRHKSKTSFWSWLESRMPFSDLNLWQTIQDRPTFDLQFRWKP
jgi:protease IV